MPQASPPVASGSSVKLSAPTEESPPSYTATGTSTPLQEPSPSQVLSSPAIPRPPAVLTNVEIAVAAVKNSAYYVGNPNLKTLVKWQAQANNFILVRKDNEEEAELEWFGEIDARLTHFNLYVDGGWKPEYKATTPLHTAKARARIIKPSRNDWLSAADCWDQIVKGFKTIQSLKTTRGATPQNMIVVDNDALKVRHVIFEPVDDDKAEEIADQPNTSDGSIVDDSSPLLMKNWTCSSDAVRAELQQIIDAGKYVGNVLPAYTSHDGEDSLISPALYEWRLRGALVSFKTSITYQHLGGKLNSDNYYAEIREIRVISRPPPPPSSPSKKRLREAQDRQNKKRITT